MGWLYPTLAWVLTILGIAALLRAWLWDRAGFRGRAALRCRGCWFDLTGASCLDELCKAQPIVCPECGRKHGSRRSMRKTRRSRWGVVLAVGLLLGGYGARVTPRIQQHGWMASVPTIVLVAWLPFMSEEQGTGLRGGLWGVGVALPKASTLDGLVVDELGTEVVFLGPSARSRQFGWLSRRLLFALARAEPIEVITDGTTAKGKAYKGAITQVLLAGGGSKSERNWANGVAYIEASAVGQFGIGEVVYGEFRIRRLVQGAYRLSGGFESAVYRCNTPDSMRINGLMPMGTPAEMAEHWIGRFLWDGVYEADRVQGRTYRNQGHAFGVAVQDPGGGGAVEVWYSIMENESERGSSPQYSRRVGLVEVSVPIEIDERRVMPIDSSQELRSWIEARLVAELSVAYDRSRQAWIPVVQLSRRDNEIHDAGSVVFGGMISVDAVGVGYPEDQGRSMMKSQSEQSWWSLELLLPENGDLRAGLLARPGSNRHFTGEVEPQQHAVPTEHDLRRRLVVRIEPVQSNIRATYGGLWGDLEYHGILVLPLADWTMQELRQYMVNGIVPDHAMP